MAYIIAMLSALVYNMSWQINDWSYRLLHMSKTPYAIKPLIDALVSARKNHQLSQSQIGELLGLPQSHVSDIEKGKKDLRLSTFMEIARALGLEVMLVPRAAVPAVNSLSKMTESAELEERPAYAIDTEGSTYE
jgi:HTH-type transcriptional regulator / antitoxin HipB